MIFIGAFSFSCGKDRNNINKSGSKSNSISDPVLGHHINHPRSESESSDASFKFNERMKLIRENCKRINSINQWSAIKTKELYETTEGGEATFNYRNGQLEKIVTQNFDETFQQVREYYMTDGQLIFVFEKSFKYNLPMYYESTIMKENDDTKAFDMDKSVITESRSYFDNGILFRQTHLLMIENF